MPYVSRDEQNKINEVFGRPQPGSADEFILNDDTELIFFRLGRLVGILNSRIKDVSNLFDQKIEAGFEFNDPNANPQIFIADEKGQRWLDRAALRARKSKGNAENKTFNMRASGIKITLADDELIDIASDLFDWATTFDDIAQDHNDSLRDIAEGAGTDDEKTTALNNYDITVGW